MTDIEVHVTLGAETHRVGTLYRQAARQRESGTFRFAMPETKFSEAL